MEKTVRIAEEAAEGVKAEAESAAQSVQEAGRRRRAGRNDNEQ